MALDAQYRAMVSDTRAFIDGRPAEAAGLIRFARSGYGHFTTMQVRGGAVKGLALHLARLQQATVELFGVALDVDAVRVQMRHALDGVTDAALRVSVGAANFTARRMPSPARIEVLMLLDPPSPPIVDPVRLLGIAHQRPLPYLKHTGMFDLLQLRRTALLQGFDDALLLQPDGRISEGTSFNVGFFDRDTLVWPDAPKLEGVTMRLLQQAWSDDAPIEHRPVTLAAVGEFDGGFCCNSGGIWPIRSIGTINLADASERLHHLSRRFDALQAEGIHA